MEYNHAHYPDAHCVSAGYKCRYAAELKGLVNEKKNKTNKLMESNDQYMPRFPIGLKIAAIYLILSGGTGLIWPLLGLGPHHPEFEAKSFAYKLGT